MVIERDVMAGRKKIGMQVLKVGLLEMVSAKDVFPEVRGGDENFFESR